MAPEPIEEALPLRGTLGAGEVEVEALLHVVVADPQGDQNRPLEHPGAGLAVQHHAAKHQRLVAVGERAAWKVWTAASRVLVTALSV